MSDINLLPDSIIHRKRIALKKGFKTMLFVLAFLLAAAVLSYKPAQRYLLESRVEKLKNKIDYGKIKQLDSVKKRISELEKAGKHIEDRNKGIYGSINHVSKVTRDIGSMMPPGLIAKTFTFYGSQGEIIIRLESNDTNDISQFLRNLYSSEKFSNIKLSSVEARVTGRSCSVTMTVKNDGEGGRP